MRTTLALVVMCVLAHTLLCQQQQQPQQQHKSWSKALARHRDKSEKGKYEPELERIKEELMYARGYGRSRHEYFNGTAPFRNDRAIDKSSSADSGSVKNQSTESTNLPKSGAKPGEKFREKSRRLKNVTIGDGICQSIDIRNNASYLEILKDCGVIEGFLQIVLMDSTTEVDFQNVSFPKLREITGYLLLYRVNGLKSLGNLLPNLEIIRGGVLLTDYAFMIYEMQNLQEIGLGKLKKITRGGVRLEKNPSLCYTRSVDWNAIVQAGDIVIKENQQDSTCPGCSQCPDGHCWTAKICQNTEMPKCHPQCFGECDGPGDRDCHVCKNYRHLGKCIERCPPKRYAYLSRRCITEEECLDMNNLRPRARLEDDQKWRPFNGSCLTQCPDGFEDHVNVTNPQMILCRVCQGRCRKIVKGANIRHISDAQIFRGTTVVNGALEFQIPNGNPNIMKELTDAFGTIEEITEYVKVTHSSPITSLAFFKKLKVIRGEKLDMNNASLVVLDNPNLSNLFDPDQHIEIQNGRLFFHYNPKLCYSKIKTLGHMVGIANISDVEVQPESNGDKVACDIVNINITVRKLGSHYADLVWSGYDTPRGQTLLSYLLNYIATENENVSYEVNSCGGNNTWQIVDVDASSFNANSSTVSKHIAGLRPYTKYAVYVKTFSARNENAYSSAMGQSKIIFFRTRSDVPSMPASLVARPISDSEILLEWKPPEEPNGPLGYYIVSGFVRSEDRQLIHVRNYCENRLLSELEQAEESEDEAGQQPDAQPTTAKTTSDGQDGCSCDDKSASLPKPFGTRIFEHFCRDNASIGHYTSSTLEWKDQCVFNKYNAKWDGRQDRKDVGAWSPADEEEIPSDDGKVRMYGGVYYSFVFNVSAAGNCSYTLRKLRHFSLYTISIAACGAKTPESGGELCSSEQYANARTRRREHADNVHNVRTRVTNNTIVEVFWDAVSDPNALTVAYTIEYTNLDVKNAKKMSDCIPVAAGTPARVKRHGYTIRNLSPGRYGLRMRSTSLAGDGNFSETIVFSVGLKEDKTALIVPLVVVGLFALIVLGGFLTWRNHRKRRQQERLIASVNPDYIETKYIVDGWEVPRENVEVLEELGLGNFGMVYRGRLDDSQVAIKTISEKASEREKNEFLNEASVMKNFSTFHIVRLLGVVSIGNPPFVIMELMENGDLKTYLRRIRDTRLVPNASRIVRMAAEIADGMAYLESKKFVHRDLAARNCMVSRDLVCKIGDFGMARDIYETDYYKVGKKGLLPIRWMAPENLSDGVFTSDSDVWSFGVVLYEILTLAEIPYQGFSNEEVLHYVLHKGVLALPRNCPENVAKIMEKCFKWRPNDRPTFMEIVAELEPFLGQDFCDKSFYHSEEGVEIRNSGIKKVYHHAAPIRFHWGNETARWVKEFEDNVTLLDQTKAGTSRGRIFKNGFQPFGSSTNNAEDVPLDR